MSLICGGPTNYNVQYSYLWKWDFLFILDLIFTSKLYNFLHTINILLNFLFFQVPDFIMNGMFIFKKLIIRSSKKKLLNTFGPPIQLDQLLSILY